MGTKLKINKLQINDNEKKLVDISFEVNTSTALIGQSGSGKSLTLKSILSLLPSNLDVKFEADSSFELNSKNIGFVPQNPFTSLSPMTKINKQFFCNEEKKLQMLKLVGLDEWVLNRFPSELSGGQLQRVVIAIAMSTDPKILLLDEPTTALDSRSKGVILDLLNDLRSKFDILILFVTHDIDSIKSICKELIIIKGGKIVEKGAATDLLNSPKHPYTKELIESGFSSREFRV